MATLIEMIKIDSPSGEEAEFSNYCLGCLKKLNFLARKDDYGNIIASNEDSSSKPFILLSGHLDTVNPGKNIQPIFEDDILKSDGNTILGCDNKLAIALYFEAIKALIKDGKKVRPLEIVLTRNEEIGMVGARHVDYSALRSKEGISFDTEGPIFHYVASSPFAEIFKINIKGRAAHASCPEKGIDALKIFSKAYSILETGRIDKNTTINFGLIEGGSGANIVMDNVCVNGNMRSQKQTELKKMKIEVVRMFNKVAKEYGGTVNVKFTKVIDGYVIPPKDSLVIDLSAAVRNKLLPIITNSGSDANIFNEHGIKVIELCNGISDTHTVSEQVSIKDASKLFEFLKIFLAV